MPLADSKCSSCGTDYLPGAMYCGQCGAKVSGAHDCPECGITATPGARFCGGCGTSLMEEGKVADGNRWSRRPGDFAACVEMSELSAFLRRGIAIQEGTRGILLQHGQQVGILEPGLHKLEGVLERLKSLITTDPCTVILVDVGDVELNLSTDDLRSSDNQEVRAAIKLVVALTDPHQFQTNLMKGTPQVTIAQLTARLTQQITSVIQSIVSDCKAEELYANRELMERIEDDIREELRRTFTRFGLSFQSVEFTGFSSDGVDQLSKERGELSMEASRFELEKEAAALKQKMSEAATEQRMAEIRNEADFEEFVKQVQQEAGIRKLMRKQEVEELWRQYSERKEDHERARRHMLATLDWQQKREVLTAEYEYSKARVTAKDDLEDRAVEHRLNTMEKEQAAELARADRAHQANLKRLDAEWHQERQHRNQQAIDDRDRDSQDWKLAREVAEWNQDRKGLNADRDQARDLERLKTESEVQQRAEAAKHSQKMEELERMGAMSVEALIAAAPSDRAVLLADLKQTEALKHLSDDQILARAAENSPEVARAFTEKFKAAAGQESAEKMEQLYERMLAQQERTADKTTEVQQQNIRMFKELMETAFQTQRDTSVAAAGAGQSPTHVVYPPAGAAASPGPMTCPACQTVAPPNARFCGNCRHQFH